MITLTPEQRIAVEQIGDWWFRSQTREVSLEQVTQAVHGMYSLAKRPLPIVTLHDGYYDMRAAYYAELDRRGMARPDTVPVWCCMWFQAWAGWFESGKLLGVQYDQEQYDLFRNWCLAVPLCIPLEEFCYVSRWPKKIVVNSDKVLDCGDGPAVEFRDGFKVWVIGGVDVNEQIVLRPETQTLAEINAEQNEEVRRLRIERFAGADKEPADGWLRYLKESKAKILDKRLNQRDGQEERLYRVHDGSRRFVCVDPSTGRRYCLRVDRKIKTCQEAQDWMSHGLDVLALHRS